jgi:predicted kinase
MKKPKINNALAMAKVFDKLNKAIPPVKEDAPGNSIAAGGVDMAPTMGPKKKKTIGGVELTNMTDRRHSAKKLPVLLKRFRKYMEDVRVVESAQLEESTPMSKQQLSSLEAVLDKAFAKLGIDVEFTKHFLDRVNDARNKTQITAKELALLYKKEYIKYGKPLAKLPDGDQGVMKDLESDINIPFVINVNRSTKEVELVAKTIMRKKNFTTPNRQYTVESAQLEEGINDPAIFKAIFLAGGPGSGKSFIVGQTALTALGFKLINSDNAFEAALAKVGLKPTPEDIYSELGQSTRVRAKIITSKKMELAANGRLGLVIDGTGKDFGNIKKQADALRKLGYDIAMIFVNTDLDTALKRNRKRVRTLPDDQVTTMWKDVQKNLGKFQSLFRQKMFIVDNSEGSNYQGAVLSVYKKMAAWAKAKPDSKGATAWIKAQKAARNIKENINLPLKRFRKHVDDV